MTNETGAEAFRFDPLPTFASFENLWRILGLHSVGARGFEPPTPRPPV